MKSECGKEGSNGTDGDGNLLVVIRPFFRLFRHFLLFRPLPLSSRWANLTPLRSHSHYCWPLMVSALCLFGGCNRDGADRMIANAPRDNARQQADGRIGQGRMNESDLENTIRARLHDDELLKGADLNVAANADRNEVTLSGVVETGAMRDRAIELARTTHSGVAVKDRIEVRQRELSRSEYTEENASEERERARVRGETIGDSLDDAWIHTMIVASLIGDQELPRHKIKVDVKNNVVTIRGVVGTAEQKVEAERVAKETEGVKRVVNQLKVEKKPGNSLVVEHTR